MSLELTHQKLGWPSPQEVRNPAGEGVRIFAELARAKIQTALKYSDVGSPEIGVLARNPQSQETESPLAIVAEFNTTASDQVLSELHRLAWNFSHAPTVVTIEPHLLRVWTCCEPPETNRFLTEYVIHEVSASEFRKARPDDETKRAAHVLHWANLVSGQFFRDRPERFRRDKRADQMLLGNLRHLREVLRKEGLTNDDVCHDLLARVIFVQFLFDRKDSSGNSALTPKKLANLHEIDVLKATHSNFASILDNYDDAYRLFDWLNERFNGDLFPGKDSTKSERERAWLEEKRLVKPRHLEKLRDFVRGDLDMPTGQLCLWPVYSFDAIPLEFISSIYEAFVTERARSQGIYYTPPHLVDFILDRVLPWGGDKWDLKVLDPACGSGIFLVKAFQRLIHRWKSSHPKEDIRADTLRLLLEKNLFGVDKDPHAVRVASFSLYLAMCDEIDPKHYWTQVHFPRMRQRRLVNADFFEETHSGFRTKQDASTYDLVIGNAPWGEELLTSVAKEWANEKTRAWPVANMGIGTLFLPKAAALTKRDGRVSLIQSASSLLFNRSGPACEFRKKFFTTFCVEEIVNLSALRFKVFNRKTRLTQKSVAPSCVVTFLPQEESNSDFSYVSPKLAEDFTEEFDMLIEPIDVKRMQIREACHDSDIWSALMWGHPRDWRVVRRLRLEPSLARLEEEGYVISKEGIIRGKNPKRQKEYAWLLNKPILEADAFPGESLVKLNASALPHNHNPVAERPRRPEAFRPPQLLIKQSWSVDTRRFQARLVVPDERGKGVICSQSYLSVRSLGDGEELLEAACLSCNSMLAVYFMLLTSGRFASYRPEALASEIPRIPVPKPKKGMLEGIRTVKDLDRRVREAFDLKDAEWVLIEDLFDVTLADFKGDENSAGRLRTRRKVGVTEEPELRRYCEYFVRVLKAGFGTDKEISATIFHENIKDALPYRLVAFHLNKNSEGQIGIKPFEGLQLFEELNALNETWLAQKKTRGGSIYNERIVRVYDSSNGTPTVYILKPDAYRYWTRSMGLYDADEVAVDLARWNAEAERATAAQG
jgi:hypothetical protein